MNGCSEHDSNSVQSLKVDDSVSTYLKPGMFPSFFNYRDAYTVNLILDAYHDFFSASHPDTYPFDNYAPVLVQYAWIT